MADILTEHDNHTLLITLNRISKHNAFDDQLLVELQRILEQAQHDHTVRVIVIKANGKHFSAGADLEWMQRMAHFSEDENIADAAILAKLMHTLHDLSKPTIAMVQGAAYGGGVGLVAACDIAIAADTALFCFSEVKIGLIPAIISPYVIKAIGERAASWLFMSAETIDANRALQLNLVQHRVPEKNLLHYTLDYAHNLAKLAPQAVRNAKALVRRVAHHPINEDLCDLTTALIAKQRVCPEGREGLQAFLHKKTPQWD